jgi:MoaA/NifB/PqqE/SkfB family radical SAM enzyme
MRKLFWSYMKNAARAKLTGSPWFDPMIATMYVTPMCNLSCTYCDDFGAHRNKMFKDEILSLEKMKAVASMLAKESDVLYITGGEPTMRTDLVEILKHARKSGFRYIAMNTNALMIRGRTDILDQLDNLVISVDSLEVGRRDPRLAKQPHNVKKLLDNVRWVATQQKSRGMILTLTSVLTPGEIAEARAVRDFAYSIGAQYSCQGLSVERLPSEELPKDPEYHAFMDELIADKRAGKNVSGSVLYLSGVRDRRPYQCTPTAAPHVDWLGRLAYPCRELPDHVWVDMIAAGSYRAALAEGERVYKAPPPKACMRCGERCYVEVSTLVRHPAALAGEVVGYLRQMADNRGAKAAAVAGVAPSDVGVDDLPPIVHDEVRELDVKHHLKVVV